MRISGALIARDCDSDVSYTISTVVKVVVVVAVAVVVVVVGRKVTKLYKLQVRKGR